MHMIFEAVKYLPQKHKKRDTKGGKHAFIMQTKDPSWINREKKKTYQGV